MAAETDKSCTPGPSKLQKKTKKEHRRLLRCSLSCTLPRVRGNFYGSTVKATQAPLVVTGALAAAPALKRITPSSFEQKLRTPDWL